VEQAADEVDQLERTKGDLELGDSDDSIGGCSRRLAWHSSTVLRETYGEEEGEVSTVSAQAKVPRPAMMAYQKGASGIPTRSWCSTSRRWGWWTWRSTGVKETTAKTAGWHPR
jgi:hypothetical protein